MPHPLGVMNVRIADRRPRAMTMESSSFRLKIHSDVLVLPVNKPNGRSRYSLTLRAADSAKKKLVSISHFIGFCRGDLRRGPIEADR